MTPNDALTHLQRSHRHSYNSNTPSLRRRLTRSPSPALSCMSLDSKSSKRSCPPSSSYSSDSDSPAGTMSRRKPVSKSFSNGHANGISHVPEETSSDETAVSSNPSDKTRRKVDWEVPRKTLHASIGKFCHFDRSTTTGTCSQTCNLK
jgi:hypothetical protein